MLLWLCNMCVIGACYFVIGACYFVIGACYFVIGACYFVVVGRMSKTTEWRHRKRRQEAAAAGLNILPSPQHPRRDYSCSRCGQVISSKCSLDMYIYDTN